MNGSKFLIWVLVGLVAGLSGFSYYKAKDPLTVAGIEIPPAECVETCIKALHNNRVFPNFGDIVKECDVRFGNGCELRGTGLPPEIIVPEGVRK